MWAARRAQDSDRLRRDDREQPGAADSTIEGRLVFLDGEARKDRVGQHDPKRDCHDPEHSARAVVCREQHELAPEDARASHCREESGPTQMIDHVAKEPAWIADHAQNGQKPQHDIDDYIEQKQRLRYGWHGQQMRANRDDARCHDHSEVRWRQVC